jgi:hypothetical protein
MHGTKSLAIASVLIPAHNESAVIKRCLDALLTGFDPDELEVVVACNGCTDGTADIVRTTWPAVHVLEIDQASKPAALRAADEMLRTFPRIYLDADVILPAASARLLIKSLQTGSRAVASPRHRYDTSRSSGLVRSYYRARERVQSATNSIWGGVYGLSEAGRSRFATFPDVIADDLFVGKWFDPAEIGIIDAGPAVITAPRRARDLVHVSRRRRQGNAEIRALPDGPSSTASSTIRSLLATASSGFAAAIDAVVFLTFAIVIRISVSVSPPKQWLIDQSSRAE